MGCNIQQRYEVEECDAFAVEKRVTARFKKINLPVAN
jgi:hypothetical protein